MNLKNELKKFVKRGNFILKSGQKTDVYFDLKEAYGDSKILNLLTETLYDELDINTTCTAASGLGGIPLASVLSSKHGFNLTLIRDDTKNHGTQKLIEGYMPNSGDKITIIDDVFTIGTSLNKTIEALNQTNAEILGAYVVIKRGEGEIPIPLHYLFNLEELV